MRLAGVRRPGTVSVVPADWYGDWDIEVIEHYTETKAVAARL